MARRTGTSALPLLLLGLAALLALALLVPPAAALRSRADAEIGAAAAADAGAAERKPGKKKKPRHNKEGNKVENAKPEAVKLELPAVSAHDVARQDRDLGEAQVLMETLKDIAQQVDTVRVSVLRLQADEALVNSVPELVDEYAIYRQRLLVTELDNCFQANSQSHKDAFVIFGATMEDGGSTSVRLDTKGDGQIFVSVVGEGSLPLEKDADRKERVSSGGPRMLLADLTARLRKKKHHVLAKFTKPKYYNLQTQGVFDKLLAICKEEERLPKMYLENGEVVPGMEVIVEWRSARGYHLKNVPRYLEETTVVIENGLGGGPGNHLLRVQHLAEAALSSLKMARYAMHPAYALKLGADLKAVRRKLDLTMADLTTGLIGAKVWVEMVKRKMNQVMAASQASMGGATKMAKELRYNFPRMWHPATTKKTLEGAIRTMEMLWAKAQLAAAPLASAYSREIRLLTLGAQATAEDSFTEPLKLGTEGEWRSHDQGFLVAEKPFLETQPSQAEEDGPGESDDKESHAGSDGNVGEEDPALGEQPVSPQPMMGLTPQEEDYEFLRAFVMADLEALGDDLPIVWKRFLNSENKVREAIMLLAADEQRDEALTEMPMRAELVAIQQALREAGAFGYPRLMQMANKLDERNKQKNKASWARQWATLRRSLDFEVWPIGSDSQRMVTPRICQSRYQHMGTDTWAQFPGWLGGGFIMHEFMIFAGGEQDTPESCQQLMKQLTHEFGSLSRTKNGQNEIFKRTYDHASRLGCLGLEHWAESGGKFIENVRRHLSALTNLTMTIKVYGEPGPDGQPGKPIAKTVSISVAGMQDQGRKHKRNHRSRGLGRGIIGAVVNYMGHTVMKYASRFGENFFAGVRTSLTRNPPFLTPEQVSNQYWDQLQAQGVASPFQPFRCHTEQGETECDDWNSSVPGYWDSARIHGDTLEAAIGAVASAMEQQSPGDWAPIAQSPALYGAVGFDSAGVVDNSEWDCENTTQICEVHPKCGRIAAQMIQYPFAGNKKYASSWKDKAYTYQQAAETGFLAKTNSFYFDKDGYHGYCHSPGKGYCWSYTACLREMLKWLCSQPATADHCCPSYEVAQACREDVNGKECNVCWDAQAHEGFSEDSQYIIPQPEQEVDNATLDFIHPDEIDLKEYADVEASNQHDELCKVCSFLKTATGQDKGEWFLIATGKDCINNRELCAETCGLEGSVEEIDDWDTCNEEALAEHCGPCEA